MRSSYHTAKGAHDTPALAACTSLLAPRRTLTLSRDLVERDVVVHGLLRLLHLLLLLLAVPHPAGVASTASTLVLLETLERERVDAVEPRLGGGGGGRCEAAAKGAVVTHCVHPHLLLRRPPGYHQFRNTEVVDFGEGMMVHRKINAKALGASLP